MVKVIGKRLAAAVAVLLVLIAVVFSLQQVSPVDPARLIVGDKASEAVVAQARHKLGLDDPLPVQYVRYVGKVTQGDLGKSAVTRRPVSTDLTTFVPATLELVLTAFALAVVLGLLLGIATAAQWRGAGVLRLLMVGGSSLPVFLTGAVGIILFYRHLHWLPATGRTSILDAPTGPTGFLTIDGLLAGRLDVVWDAWQHLILPATCLAMAPAVAIGRVLRSSLVAALRSEYVRTARAKGLSELRVVARHALRNSAGPVLAISGLQIAALFGAELVVEVMFAWPGMGLYTAQAVNKDDFTTIAGITLVLGALYVLANAIVDLLQAAADPRISTT
jgi:peptide/nickel transport system permease protein